MATEAKEIRHELIWTRFWVSHKYTFAAMAGVAVAQLTAAGALTSPAATLTWVKLNWWSFAIGQCIAPTLRAITASREQPPPTQATVEEAKQA